MVVEKTVLIGLQDFHLRAGGALPFKQQKSAVTGLYKRIVTHPMQGRVSAESDQRGLHSARERRTQHLHEYATVRQLVRRYTQRSNSLGAEQHSWCARVCARVYVCVCVWCHRFNAVQKCRLALSAGLFTFFPERCPSSVQFWPRLSWRW